MVIVIDFDNTIAKEQYPNIGHIFLFADQVINGWFNDGNEIIINSCCTGRYEAAAVDFLQDNNIQFSYVNCNLPRMVTEFKMDCRKISGDIHIDDKNLGGLPMIGNTDQPDWLEIDLMVRRHPKYTIKC